MKQSDFDYHLPKELIAQRPLENRESSRLMVLHRHRGTIEHTCFACLPDYLSAQDLLVANNTRVIPARLYGTKASGGWVEVFLLHFIENDGEGSQIWECLLKSRRKMVAASRLYFHDDLCGEVLGPHDQGTWRVRLRYRGSFDEIIRRFGTTPLPPYIKRGQNDPRASADKKNYQTVYARRDGAVAAPTAGLHFTRPLIDIIKRRCAGFAYLTLHVGYGTFQPIRSDKVENHTLHGEEFHIPHGTAEHISRIRARGGRVFAVGTTTTRALESMSSPDGQVRAGAGSTDLYIYPGYRFRAVNALITNFHVPRSSLLLLVCAFAGRDFVLRAYREAVANQYRFFSYGDAMLIL